MTDEEIAAQIVRRLGAQQRLIRAVERLKLPVVDGIDERVDEMELAARDLTNVVDDLPVTDRPEGWALEPDGVDA